MPKNVFKRIKAFNKDRDPELVKYKYEALTQNSFRFFRGTCHLFYEDIPHKSFLLKSPKAWICGDLHLENFGSFKGDNRLAYFDMNDFDESLLGPCLLDISRLCTSVFLGSDMTKMSKPQSAGLVKSLLQSYNETLAAGYIREIEEETSKGVVKGFLHAAANRKRIELLRKRVDLEAKHPTIKLYELTTLKADKPTKATVRQAVDHWVKKNNLDWRFFKVLDVCNRANGTGSIGIQRHLVLVNGKGKPDGYYLLDVKQALKSSALYSLKLKQPKWKSEAERLVAIQKRVQASSPAFLSTLKMAGGDFIIKELQPLEDKIDFEMLAHDTDKLQQLVKDMGRIAAWNNLRSGGRQGSAIADKMIRFGERMDKTSADILDYSEKYADKVRQYWSEFKEEYTSPKPSPKERA